MNANILHRPRPKDPTRMPNRVSELFHIRYPIVMGAISQTPELAALVSNAGGLGCIAGAGAPPDLLRERIR